LDRFNALKKNGKSGLALSTTSAFSSMIAGAYSGFAADAGELFMHVRHRLVRRARLASKEPVTVTWCDEVRRRSVAVSVHLGAIAWFITVDRGCSCRPSFIASPPIVTGLRGRARNMPALTGKLLSCGSIGSLT
jgi:hypothetical protein